MKKEKKYIIPEAYIIELFDNDIITDSEPFDDNDDVGQFTTGMIH